MGAVSATPSEERTDLHEIFGLEGGAGGAPDPTVVVAMPERPGDGPEVTLEPAGASSAPEHAVEVAGGGGAAPPAERPKAPEGRVGITSPTRRGSSSRFLTDVIVEMGLVARERVDDAIATSRSSGTTPERVLIDESALSHDGLARALAERYGLDHLDLGVFQVDMGAANLVTTAAAKRYQAVPVAFVDKRTLLVAMADPSNVLAVDDIAIMTGYEVRVAVAAPEDIVALISRLDRLDDVVSGQRHRGGGVARRRSSSCTRPPTTRRSSSSSTRSSRQAVEQGASDVHITPDGKETARALPHRRRAAPT